jgi:dienelactone hydrolase
MARSTKVLRMVFLASGEIDHIAGERCRTEWVNGKCACGGLCLIDTGDESGRLGGVFDVYGAIRERNWSAIEGRAEYYELASRLVRGQTLLGKVLHDVRVALDYLAIRPEVDPSRIGFIGHSYGGRMAVWATAFDERIRAAVANCGCVNYRNSLTRDAGIQMAFCVPGILTLGDLEDVLRLVEPRALLIQAAEDDKWSRGAQMMFDHARSAFPEGQLEIRTRPGGHRFSRSMRETAYAFLDCHLTTAVT